MRGIFLTRFCAMEEKKSQIFSLPLHKIELNAIYPKSGMAHKCEQRNYDAFLLQFFCQSVRLSVWPYPCLPLFQHLRFQTHPRFAPLEDTAITSSIARANLFTPARISSGSIPA